MPGYLCLLCIYLVFGQFLVIRSNPGHVVNAVVEENKIQMKVASRKNSVAEMSYKIVPSLGYYTLTMR
jgi:hypothetical protein